MIGILGGTFDPIHYGHLYPADEARARLALDEVRVIPAALPPHRPPPAATAAHRLRMAQLAVTEFAGFHVDDRELRRTGPSYTVPTLESLRAEAGTQPLCLLIGADAFGGIESWYQWQRLPELAHLVIMGRPGWQASRVNALPEWARARVCRDGAALARAAAGGIAFIDVTPRDISATRIREIYAAGGEPPADWLPAKVAAFIHEHQLYRTHI